MNTTQITTRRHIRSDLISLAFLAFAGFAGMAGSNAALAADGPEAAPRTLTVQYPDLNLSSAQGIEQLYSRITAAASAVCDETDPRSLRVWVQTRICTNRSIERAVAATHLPALVALHAARTGQLTPVQVVKR
jgi:UrcA family protein